MEPSTNCLENEQLDELNNTLNSLKPHLIVAPSRTSSTALARTLSNHSKIGPGYIHEPCDLYYHKKREIASIIESIKDNLLRNRELHEGVLIKEMTFQMGTGSVFELFIENAFKPIIFLIRNPTLSIESRIRKVCKDRILAGRTNEKDIKRLTWAVENKDYSCIDDLMSEHVFPLYSTGWDAFQQQVEFCGKTSISFIILDATSFRQKPEGFIKKICDRWNIDFEPKMLVWNSGNGVSYGNLAEQNHWYERVSKSKGILPPNEQPINLSKFPKRFRKHVTGALTIYNSVLEYPNMLK